MVWSHASLSTHLALSLSLSNIKPLKLYPHIQVCTCCNCIVQKLTTFNINFSPFLLTVSTRPSFLNGFFISVFSLFFFRPPSLTLTEHYCCMPPQLRASIALPSQTGSQPSQWDTHFATAKRTARDMCSWLSVQVVCFCTSMCSQVFFKKRQLKTHMCFRSASSPIITVRTKKTKMSTKAPFLSSFSFRGNMSKQTMSSYRRCGQDITWLFFLQFTLTKTTK